MAPTYPSSSPQSHLLSHLSALFWALALVAYTWAIATRARTSVPPCPCKQYAAAFLPLNHSIVPSEQGISHHCYDSVRWAMSEDAKPGARHRVHAQASNAGTNHVVARRAKRESISSNVDTMEAMTRRWKRRGDGGKFYGKVDEAGGDPPDREAYVSFFVGNEGQGRTFVEVGAGNGVRGSTSLFFEESLGWHGLLIDGAVKVSGRAPTTKVVNAVVCHPRMEGQKVKWVGNGEGGGVEMYMSKEHTDRYSKDWGKDWRGKEKAVKCVALGGLLEAAGIDVVDLMIVSVNGAESAVLEGLDVNRVHVGVAVVKVGEGDERREREVRKVLLERGLCFSHRAGRNEFWVGAEVLKIAHCGWAALKEDP